MRDAAYVNQCRARLKAARRRVEEAYREHQRARDAEYGMFIEYLNALGAGPYTEVESRATERLINTMDRHREVWLKRTR